METRPVFRVISSDVAIEAMGLPYETMRVLNPVDLGLVHPMDRPPAPIQRTQLTDTDGLLDETIAILPLDFLPPSWRVWSGPFLFFGEIGRLELVGFTELCFSHTVLFETAWQLARQRSSPIGTFFRNVTRALNRIDRTEHALTGPERTILLDHTAGLIYDNTCCYTRNVLGATFTAWRLKTQRTIHFQIVAAFRGIFGFEVAESISPFLCAPDLCRLPHTIGGLSNTAGNAYEAVWQPRMQPARAP